MRTIFYTAIFLFISFILPLIGKIDMLFEPRVIFSVVVITLLLNSQPRMKFNEAEHNKRTDKGTMFLILVTSIIGHIGSIIEWAYFPQIDLKFLSFIGAGLLIFGIIFRVVAIRSLKNAFSNTIQIKEGQKLFDKGLYSKFRHPSYTGAWVLFVGDALLFQSYFGIAILGFGMFLVYMKRISVEEELLKSEYGVEYEQYMRRTWKFLPGF